jgi:oxaloacetate decarboxylase (Na+ extruding) subunit alpha
VRIVQESGVAEITVEEAGTRVSVRRRDDSQSVPVGGAGERAPAATTGEGLPAAPADGVVHVTAPMVGTFYRAPEPGAKPFVEEGDVVEPGQTLCILEAMKLMNEVKSETEGIVRTIHVRNAEPVEYGQLLFDLEAVEGRPLDAL